MPNSNLDRDLVMKAGTKLKTSAGTTVVDVDSSGVPSITANIQDSLAQGSIYIGNSSGVTSELSIKTSGHILVGNGTTATLVAVSGDAALSSAGVITIANQVVTRAKASNALQHKNSNLNSPTIATTGNTDVYFIASETGTLDSVDFSGVDALAASDTNYITWSMVNLGADGSGSTNMLDTGATNTTKVTGGSALTANTKRTLGVNGTPANLNVNSGDRIRIRAAATGTLANTVTFPAYCIRLSGTT